MHEKTNRQVQFANGSLSWCILMNLWYIHHFLIDTAQMTITHWTVGYHRTIGAFTKNTFLHSTVVLFHSLNKCVWPFVLMCIVSFFVHMALKWEKCNLPSILCFQNKNVFYVNQYLGGCSHETRFCILPCCFSILPSCIFWGVSEGHNHVLNFILY